MNKVKKNIYAKNPSRKANFDEIFNRIKTTKSGMKYIAVSKEECCNWGGYGLCDKCNNKFDKGYLVGILRECFCKECFKKYLLNYQMTQEDLYYQNNINHSVEEYFICNLDEWGIKMSRECGKQRQQEFIDMFKETGLEFVTCPIEDSHE